MSVMTSDVEHFSLYLSAICMSFFEKYLDAMTTFELGCFFFFFLWSFWSFVFVANIFERSVVCTIMSVPLLCRNF